MRSLLEIHTTNTGKVSDKWESYFPVYERIFAPYRDLPIDFLEIGVQNGGSLEVWSDYFLDARVVIGCDIDPKCGQLRFTDKRIKVVVGSSNTQDTEAEIAAHCGSFDVVIDDGSHISDDIVQTFLIYFERVKPGGIFVVEDTHTLYWEGWGGGIVKKTSAQELFKLFTDLVNHEHWKNDLALPVLFSTFFRSHALPRFLTEGWIESIEFSNSMIVIRKAVKPGSLLGRRIITGTTAEVDAAPLRLLGIVA